MYDHTRTIKPLDQLTRPELAARVRTLRQAMDDLAALVEYDGGPAFECMGRMRVTLVNLEARLRSMGDRVAYNPYHG